MKQQLITYGPGGFKSDRADKNIIDQREIDVPDEPPGIEQRLAALENATGTGTGDDAPDTGKRGIAQRLDNLEDRLAAIEEKL